VSDCLKMSLDIACADACMPMAINHYFQRLIFTSWNEFVERQRLLAGASRIYIQPGHCGDWHFRMMQRVRTARHIYAKKIVFSTRLHRNVSFSFRLPHGHSRAIFRYRLPNHASAYDHVEAVETNASGDGFSFLRYPRRQTLPFMRIGVAEYIRRCYEPFTNDWYMEVFVYSK
jgi:hypothetical protein